MQASSVDCLGCESQGRAVLCACCLGVPASKSTTGRRQELALTVLHCWVQGNSRIIRIPSKFYYDNSIHMRLLTRVQAAKHGVLGLMRSLRLYVPEALNIRVNAICPWMTATQVVAGIEDAWYAAKLPVNQPADVAEVLLNVTRSSDVHGKAFYMEGGRAWEIEDNIDRLEPQWLGERQSRDLARGQETLGNVCCFRPVEYR